MADGIKVGDAYFDTGLKMKGLDKDLNTAGKKISGLSPKIGQVGKAMTVAGGAIVGALGLAVKQATTFHSAMAEVGSLGVKDLGKLSDAVLDTAGKYGQDLTASAKAAYQAISAGASEMEAPLILEKSAMAATAGVTDLATAVELGMGVSNAFGRELGDLEGVFDQAFLAVKNGVTTFEELSSSVGKVAPTMAAAGLGTEELFGSIAALTKGGIATREAVTGLKAALSNIIKPTSQMVGLFEDMGGPMKAMQELGFEEFLMEVKERTGGSVSAMGELFSSTEALNVVLALTGEQAGSFANIMEQMRSPTGAMQEAFDAILEKDPALAFKMLSAEFKVLLVRIGSGMLPALRSLVEVLKPFMKWLGDAIAAHPKLTAAIVTLMGVLGALSLILGPILIFLSSLGGSFTAVGGIITAVANSSIPALVVSLGPLVLAGGALAFAIINVYEMVRAIRDWKKANDTLTESNKRNNTQVDDFRRRVEQMGGTIDEAAWSSASLTEKNEMLQAEIAKLSEKQKEGTGIAKEAAGSSDGMTGSLEHQARATEMTSRQQARLNYEVERYIHLNKKAAGGLVGHAAGGLVGHAAGGLARFAAGGMRSLSRRLPSGMALVGERGPEIVRMNTGSQVLSHNETKQIARESASGGAVIGGDLVVNVQGGANASADQIADRITKKIRQNLVGRGLK
jgi:TP901 family phage tail tape measure protein